jgi:hypothetical protein
MLSVINPQIQCPYTRHTRLLSSKGNTFDKNRGTFDLQTQNIICIFLSHDFTGVTNIKTIPMILSNIRTFELQFQETIVLIFFASAVMEHTISIGSISY